VAPYAICGGVDPAGRNYDVQEMVDVIDVICTGSIDLVPPATEGPAENLMTKDVGKLHCICHQPSTMAPTMIKCSSVETGFTSTASVKSSGHPTDAGDLLLPHKSED